MCEDCYQKTETVSHNSLIIVDVQDLQQVADFVYVESMHQGSGNRKMDVQKKTRRDTVQFRLLFRPEDVSSFCIRRSCHRCHRRRLANHGRAYSWSIDFLFFSDAPARMLPYTRHFDWKHLSRWPAGAFRLPIALHGVVVLPTECFIEGRDLLGCRTG